MNELKTHLVNFWDWISTLVYWNVSPIGWCITISFVIFVYLRVAIGTHPTRFYDFAVWIQCLITTFLFIASISFGVTVMYLVQSNKDYYAISGTAKSVNGKVIAKNVDEYSTLEGNRNRYWTVIEYEDGRIVSYTSLYLANMGSPVYETYTLSGFNIIHKICFENKPGFTRCDLRDPISQSNDKFNEVKSKYFPNVKPLPRGWN